MFEKTWAKKWQSQGYSRKKICSILEFVKVTTTWTVRSDNGEKNVPEKRGSFSLPPSETDNEEEDHLLFMISNNSEHSEEQHMDCSMSEYSGDFMNFHSYHSEIFMLLLDIFVNFRSWSLKCLVRKKLWGLIPSYFLKPLKKLMKKSKSCTVTSLQLKQLKKKKHQFFMKIMSGNKRYKIRRFWTMRN